MYVCAWVAISSGSMVSVKCFFCRSPRRHDGIHDHELAPFVFKHWWTHLAVLLHLAPHIALASVFRSLAGGSPRQAKSAKFA